MLIGLCAVVLAGCVTALNFVPPCAFDPPPGDVYTLTVVNDTPATAVVAGCTNDSCRKGYDAALLPPGEKAQYNVESCTGGQVAVADPADNSLTGCLDEPRGEPVLVTKVLVSGQHACRQLTTQQSSHDVLTIVDPRNNKPLRDQTAR